LTKIEYYFHYAAMQEYFNQQIYQTEVRFFMHPPNATQLLFTQRSDNIEGKMVVLSPRILPIL